MLDQCSDGDTGLVEEVVVKRASMLAGLLMADLSACLWGMHALGTQTQRSAPGGTPPQIPDVVCMLKMFSGNVCASLCRESVLKNLTAAHLLHNV